jgi:hypothetical protein
MKSCLRRNIFTAMRTFNLTNNIFIQETLPETEKHDRKCTYNVPLKRVCIAIVAVEKQ